MEDSKLFIGFIVVVASILFFIRLWINELILDIRNDAKEWRAKSDADTKEWRDYFSKRIEICEETLRKVEETNRLLSERTVANQKDIEHLKKEVL